MINQVVRRISLDLSRKSNVGILFSSQSDMDTRVFIISLFDDGKPYIVSKTLTAAVNVLRSNGTNRAFMAEVTDDGCIKYTAGAWALGIDGLTKFSVSLYDGEERRLTSSIFTIDISPGLFLGSQLSEDDEEFTVYGNIMNELARQREAMLIATQESIDATESAEVAAAAADEAAQTALNAARRAENELSGAVSNANTAKNSAEKSAKEAKESEESAGFHSQDAYDHSGRAATSATFAAASAEKAATSSANAAASARSAANSAEALRLASYGLMPIINAPCAVSVTVAANRMTNIAELSRDCQILLGTPVDGFDNEWCFTVKQGEIAYGITLPEVSWSLGIAPVFDVNSFTEVRLHYKGDVLEGVWC